MTRQIPENTGEDFDDDLENEIDDEIEDDPNIAEDGEARLNVIAQSLYDMRIPKGTVGNIQIMLWDKVRDCRGVDCPLFDQCYYFSGEEKIQKAKRYKIREKSLGKCRVEQKYLQNTLKPFFRLLRKVPDEFVMQTIGQHLVPLYHDLVLFLMEKAALKELTYTDGKGMKRIHPVFDQLDKIHGRISRTWRESGLQTIAKEVGYFQAGHRMIPEGDALDDEYDAMSQGVALKSANPKPEKKQPAKKTAKKSAAQSTDAMFEDI